MLDNYFDRLVEETKGTDRNIRKLFHNTLRYLQQIINNEIQEGALVANKTKSLSLNKKRELLKKIYAQVLQKMGQENNINVFMNLIDNVPEDYIDYELQINTAKAGEFVNDLIKGKDQISGDELKNIANIVNGVGVPAILNHATGKNKLDKESASFGANAINKNVKDYLDSKKSKRANRKKISDQR